MEKGLMVKGEGVANTKETYTGTVFELGTDDSG